MWQRDCTPRHACSCWELLTVTFRSLLKSESWSSSPRLNVSDEFQPLFKSWLKIDVKLRDVTRASANWFVDVTGCLVRQRCAFCLPLRAPALAVGAPQRPALPPRWLQLMKAGADSSAGLNARINSLWANVPPKLEGPASADVSQVNRVSTSTQLCLEMTEPTMKNRKALSMNYKRISSKCSFVPSQLQHSVFHLNWDVRILPPYL